MVIQLGILDDVAIFLGMDLCVTVAGSVLRIMVSPFRQMFEKESDGLLSASVSVEMLRCKNDRLRIG